MKKTRTLKTLRASVSAFTALLLLVGALIVPAMRITPDALAEESDGYITKLDKLVNYSQYLDNKVMFKLPDTVGADQDISVIITVDNPTVLDAYEKSAKTMSFTEYALYGDDAREIKETVSEKKNALLNALGRKKKQH